MKVTITFLNVFILWQKQNKGSMHSGSKQFWLLKDEFSSLNVICVCFSGRFPAG